MIGYAVEAGLKACVLAYVEDSDADVIFRERRFSESCWAHDIRELVRLAGLRAELSLALASNKQLAIKWKLAFAWKEVSRHQTATEFDA